ncbi:MAG: transcription antitermination factor NusB [Defluviitaleaceae bacterium]|nr:transcription antitermination factor NusB [Defluviitaleaceae bacterium]MCL2224933.1 transcription antitermination factor NusB [Defluviitaleaceae bacterium]MCL2262505.1 transcription antitermination factor NusB [Defluviitaleaceae bacterium]
MKKTSRRTARQHVFHLIFGLPFIGALDVPTLAKAKAAYFDFLEYSELEEYGFENLKRPTKRDAEYIDRAFWGVFERRAELDGVIENFLRDWTIGRLNKADLALMRLAIYEMLCEKDVPPAVAVNESVELAKLYGADESPAFINGVLGNVARAWEKKEA